MMFQFPHFQTDRPRVGVKCKLAASPFHSPALNPASQLALIAGCPQFVLDLLPSFAGTMMGAMINNPVLGGLSMLSYRFLMHGDTTANLADFDQRRDWLTGEMGPDYDALGPAGREYMIDSFTLDDLAGAERAGDTGIDTFVAEFTGFVGITAGLFP